MKAIRCELCGFNQLIKDGDYYVCEACGTKYSLEEARKLIVSGTVEVVRGTAECDRILSSGDRFLDAGEFHRALEQYNKALIDFPEYPVVYEKILNAIVTKGCAFIKRNAREWYVTNHPEYLIGHLNYIYRGYKAISDDPKDISVFQERFYQNFKDGNIIFIGFKCSPDRYQADPKGEHYAHSNDVLKKLEQYLQQLAGTERAKEIMEESGRNVKILSKYRSKSERSWEAQSFLEEFGYADIARGKNIIFYYGKTLITQSFSDPGYNAIFHTTKRVVEANDLQLAKTAIEETELYNNRKKNYLCVHCGGKLKGILHPVCTVCGKPQ